MYQMKNGTLPYNRKVCDVEHDLLGLSNAATVVQCSHRLAAVELGGSADMAGISVWNAAR